MGEWAHVKSCVVFEEKKTWAKTVWKKTVWVGGMCGCG